MAILTSMLILLAIVIVLIGLLIFNGAGKLTKTLSTIGVCVSLVFVVMFYNVVLKDERAYQNADIIEITDVVITEVSDSKLNFVYWLEDNELQEGSVSVQDIKIGDKVTLGIKDAIDYKLSSDGFRHHERVQYLTLTREKLNELKVSR